MVDYTERSEGGSQILRHQARERGLEIAEGDEEAIQQIEAHIAQHIGDPARVFHEILSDLVHLDVHIVAPTPARNYYTLVTSGMSDRPMHTPPGAEHLRYAEMLICLPPTWRLGEHGLEENLAILPPHRQGVDDSQEEANYWPIGWLKQLARLPHEYDTWLGAAHTIPNGDPARPFAANTALCCALIAEPKRFGHAFPELTVSPDKTIHFLSFVPIYKEEMDFKLKNGSDALMERLAQAGVTELLDIARPNVCRKKLFGLF